MRFDEYMCHWPIIQSRIIPVTHSCSLFLCSHLLWATTILIYIRVCFVCSWSSYEWDHTFPFVPSFLDQRVSVTHPCCCMYRQFLLFMADHCPWYDYKELVCSPADENFNCSQFGALENTNAINCLVQVFSWTFVIEKKFQDHKVGLCLGIKVGTL